MRIPQRRRPNLAVLLCIGLLPAATAADTTPTPRAAIELPDLNRKERAWAQDPTSIPGPLQLGFGRAVPVASAMEALSPSRWQQTPSGGRLLTVQLRSPGALGLRVVVAGAAWPDAALLGFFDANGKRMVVFSGAELNAAHGPFWSPLMRGDVATVAVGLPPGYEPTSAVIALPQVSHLVRWPFDDADTPDSAGNPCRLDVTCRPDWQRISRATALLVYTDATGGTGVCTGTLLHDRDPTTDVPYLITAAHCAPDASRAASIEAVWFHHASRCGSNVGAPVQTVSGGAELLQTDPVTDISLLRLRRPAPAGAVFADWAVDLPELGISLASVHQSQGLGQAIAWGTLTGLMPCDEVPLCEVDGEDDERQYLRVAWGLDHNSDHLRHAARGVR
jgi:hypothetical protein